MHDNLAKKRYCYEEEQKEMSQVKIFNGPSVVREDQISVPTTQIHFRGCPANDQLLTSIADGVVY